MPFGHCNSEMSLSLTWECHEGKLNVSVLVLHREEKQQVAQGAAWPAYKLQKSATLEFASEHKVDVSCNFAPVLSHLRMGDRKMVRKPIMVNSVAVGSEEKTPATKRATFPVMCPATSVLITTFWS